MGCPVTPLSCLTPSNIFAGVFKPACGGFADPSKFQAERALYNSGFSELINNFGVDINYYVNTYNLSAANNFYGEHTVAPYYGPVAIRAYVEYQHNAVPLQTYGWEPDDSVTLYFHIQSFTTAFNNINIHLTNGQRIEPKADDGFILTPFGCDRPASRNAKTFVVTEVIDEDGSTINPLAGHYIWKVTAKRYDYSFEAGFPDEDNNVQVYDNAFSGVLSSSITLLDQLSTTQLSSNPKSYPMDVDEIVKTQIFDNTVNDTSIYGQYF
jgi:hypothetical protein